MGSKTQLPGASVSPSNHHGGSYDWVDGGMVGYDHRTNLYLVKRSKVPAHILDTTRKQQETDYSRRGISHLDQLYEWAIRCWQAIWWWLAFLPRMSGLMATLWVMI